MVVQEEDEPPVEASTKQPKKYLVVKNHVRELLSESEGFSLTSDNAQKTSNVKINNLKRKKHSPEVLPSISAPRPTDINGSDMEELRAVYKKCKAVLQKIESKYGHLLNLEDHVSPKITSEESSSDHCTCSQKKKIIFDENGQQIEKDCPLENHICTKRIKRSHSYSQPDTPALQVEYEDIYINLPNNLQDLENILKDKHIDKSYRKMVIDKIYLIRQEYLNEIRYEKQSIIKQLKENPDELLNFKGTNISSLPGYPTMPIKDTDSSKPS